MPPSCKGLKNAYSSVRAASRGCYSNPGQDCPEAHSRNTSEGHPSGKGGCLNLPRISTEDFSQCPPKHLKLAIFCSMASDTTILGCFNLFWFLWLFFVPCYLNLGLRMVSFKDWAAKEHFSSNLLLWSQDAISLPFLFIPWVGSHC